MEMYYEYDLSEYPFVRMFQDLFQRKNLQEIHLDVKEKYEFFSEPGVDSDTVLHRVFYDEMRKGWPEFIQAYQRLIREVIAPIVGAKDELIYQKWPSFRVHLPNNVAVGGWHKDGDYNHPSGEINFILAITKMFESNSTIAESEPGKNKFLIGHYYEVMKI